MYGLFGQNMGGMMGGYQPIPWWMQVQQRAQMPNRGPAPYFFQQPQMNYYQPSFSPYSFMPMMQQPSGFRPTPTAEPIMTPEVNNPADPMLPQAQSPQAPPGPSQGLLSALSDARSAMQSARDAYGQAQVGSLMSDGYKGPLYESARREADRTRRLYEQALYNTTMGGGNGAV